MLTAPVTTPTRRGWMRYFLAALALCSPVYVQAADETEAVAEKVQTLTWTGDNGAIWKTGADASADSWDGNTAYVNGTSVSFDGTSATATADTRKVTIEGTVAPGSIDVDAGTIDTDYGVENFGVSGKVDGDLNAQMLYGYAFEGGTIADYVDAEGEVTKTSITKTGDATLVLNSANTFTGGVTVNDGSLYLGAEGAAGTGTITLNTKADCTWNEYLNTGDGKFISVGRTGAQLIVNFNQHTATVANAIELSGEGQAHISYGYATYGDSATLPSTVTRNVQLTGGISGSGDLHLYGYSHASAQRRGGTITATYNYVSNFTINTPDQGGSFTGKVYLHNNYTTSETQEAASWADWYLGGAVQLTLQDNVFSNAVISMTRDKNDSKIVGWPGIVGWTTEPGPAMTSDNILVLDGSTQLKGLEATFKKAAWYHGAGSFGISWGTTNLEENLAAQHERWRVRVVTSGADNTLTLHDDTDATHQFDGAVGFKQSYVSDSQSYVSEYDGGKNGSDASFEAGGGSLGEAGLSLVKSGQAKQYIHSAMLNNLTIKGGTLGFNHLTLSGNLSMTGGSTLQLGATDAGWGTFGGNYYETSTGVTIGSGKVMSLAPAVAANGGVIDRKITSTVSGNVTIADGATLDFSFLGSDPTKYNQGKPLLTVSGTLTLNSGADVTVDFAGIEYFSANKVYYLAGAETFTDNAGIVGTKITLGHGYHGTFGKQGNFLILTIGTPTRRTWSGVTSGTGASGVWSAGTDTSESVQWKEGFQFANVGQTVLFGNLKNPYTAAGTTVDTTVVTGTANTGYPDTEFSIDGETISVQMVDIKGTVTPTSVIINPGYYEVNANGENKTAQTDSTHYYFYTSDGTGVIGDYGNTKTTLLKQGEGTAIIATANTYSGGTTIEGGRLVMKNAAALGKGGIIIQNGATLQGDFDEMYIENTITVKHNAGNIQAQDAVLRGREDTRLTIADLDGAADTTLLLQGNASAAGKYGVFEVVDASGFSGTVKLAGYQDGPGTRGNVQLQITSSATNDTWKNATIDLSTDAANRTVLALNPTDDSPVQLSALQGTGANSSVVNMSGNAITLEFLGTQVGVYQGALGYGDYSGGHDEGNNDGVMNVIKNGTSDQTVRSAWLGTLSVNGGNFIVTEDLVVKNLVVKEGNHLVIGNPVDTSYGLNVGAGGILAIEGNGISQNAANGDAFANIGGGVASGITQVPDTGSTEEGAMKDVAVWPDKFILFSDGATITAAGDWFTASPGYSETILGETRSFTRDIKIADGASVTFNTHHYTADASLYGSATYLGSHVMHLLGNMSGSNVNLTFNNQLISAGAQTRPTDDTADSDVHYKDDTGTEMGFVAIKDIHQFKGDSHITVKDKTVLQVTENNDKAATSADKMSVLVQGDNAAIQFTSQDASGNPKSTDGINQYVDEIVLKDGGHVLVGGDLKYNNKNGNTAHTELDYTDVALDITNRPVDDNTTKGYDDPSVATITKATISGTITNGKVTDTTISGNSPTDRAQIQNALVKTHNANSELTVKNANITSSIVQLHNSCTVDLKHAVLVDKNSAIVGSMASKIETGPQVYDESKFTTFVDGVDDVKRGADVASSNEKALVSRDTLVALTTNGSGTIYTAENGTQVMHFVTTSFQNINVTCDDLTGYGLTIFLAENIFDVAYSMGMEYIAIQIEGGQFQLENNGSLTGDFEMYANNGYEITGAWVSSGQVNLGAGIVGSEHLIWLKVPEPATATLSLLALAGLCARRRRK